MFSINSFIKFLLVILAIFGVVFLISSCSENSTTTSPGDDHTYLSLPFPPDSSFAGVTSLLVRVTAPDLASAITATHEIDHNQSYALVNLDVPAGANRRFTVYGINDDDDSLYWASVTIAIAGGRRNDVAAMLIPINQRTRVFIPYPLEPLFDNVEEIKITVTGSDIAAPLISTQAVDHDQSSMVFNLAVPAGQDRYFEIIGLDPTNQNLYVARLTSSISDSQSTNLAVTLAQAGFGQTTRVRIFRNILPWGLADLDSLLISLGFTQGAGDNQYQVFNSTLMGSILLTPGRDLVIFEGWQDTSFYSNYMSARDYFEEFIDSGGSVLMLANEGGIHSWYYDSTGMEFPGGIIFQSGSHNYNRVVSQYHSITAGLDDSISGSSASHGGFGSLPPGAMVLTEDLSQRPTLVIFELGRGSVVMSTQPLENLYNHRNTYSAGSLLSRIVRFMLGLDPTPNPKEIIDKMDATAGGNKNSAG